MADPLDLGALSLMELLIGAAEAPPGRRIEFRDAIASHGAAAIAGVEAWLRDPMLAAFAVRTVARAASFSARERRSPGSASLVRARR